MAYKQTAYQQKVGNSGYTIAEIGCFLTSFCNLLAERFGKNIDPPSLNNFFTNHKVYLDGDLLAWGSVSAYDTQVHVMATGGAGWPKSNNSIVKFLYKDHSGHQVTHFCLVANASEHTIVDSWDGVTKKSPYGNPIAWAEYEKAGGHPITPVKVSHESAPTKPKVGLPNYDGHSITVQPGWGLSNAAHAAGYPDFNEPERWLAITHLNGGKDWQTFNANLKSGQRIVVGHYDPPKSVSKPSTPHQPAKPAHIVYTRLEKPLKLVTNKQPTHKWALDFPDYKHVKSVHDLDKGVGFVAFGRAQRTDLDRPAYFMTESDFGNADKTGIPAHNQGVNTVDLSPPPKPAPAKPPAEQQQSKPAPATTPESADSDSIPVTVNWKASYTAFLSPQTYIANKNIAIEEIDTDLPADPDHPLEVQLVNDQPVIIAGTFSRNGQKYYRTAKSVEHGYWYGIPEDALDREDEKQADDLIDQTLAEAPGIRKELGTQTGKEKLLESAGKVDGWFSKVFHKNKKG